MLKVMSQHIRGIFYLKFTLYRYAYSFEQSLTLRHKRGSYLGEGGVQDRTV